MVVLWGILSGIFLNLDVWVFFTIISSIWASPGMLNLKGIRPSSLEIAVFFIGVCPGKVTVAVTGREAAGEPSTEVTDAYWKKMLICYFDKMPGFKNCPQTRINYFYKLGRYKTHWCWKIWALGEWVATDSVWARANGKNLGTQQLPRFSLSIY